MTTIKAISDALKTRLSALEGKPPTIWENQEKDPAKFPAPPLLLVQLLRNPPVRLTHRGGHQLSGQLQVTVLLSENKYTSAAETIAEQIAQHFPSGLRLGQIEIPARANITTGYSDPPYWRLPVLIPWRVLD